MNTEPYESVTPFDSFSDSLDVVEHESIRHFKGEIRLGRPWSEALLESISMWTLPQEESEGRIYKYVIHGEAFDWLLLAERMCSILQDNIPETEMEDLLFDGKFPIPVTGKDIGRYLGYNKYRGILNFWYGVVVEEALRFAVEDEVRKEMRAGGRVDVEDMSEESYRRIYDDDLSGLLGRFRSDMNYPSRFHISLAETKEFTYWLFKLRLRYWDPARVASDTRKGLDFLQQVRGSSSPF